MTSACKPAQLTSKVASCESREICDCLRVKEASRVERATELFTVLMSKTACEPNEGPKNGDELGKRGENGSPFNFLDLL